MKNKKKIFLIILIAILLIGGCLLVYKLTNKKYSNIVSITVSELETKIQNKETFILVVSQTGCSHCKQYLPELNRTLKKINLTAYDLNVTGLKSEEATTLNKYINFSGTPTTFFYRDGEEKTTLNRITGYADEIKILERLKSLGYTE